MEDRGTRKSKLLIKLEHHQSIFGFRPTHNPKVAGSNPAPATIIICNSGDWPLEYSTQCSG